MAVESVFGAETVWTSDIDPGACKIIAHRYPGVPNLGDITAIDWAAVEPVDIITAGFPCQDLSHAGKRAGMHEGTRSGLWSYVTEAIETIRPRYMVAENVRGLLSATATSDLESCPWCLGGSADGEPALRALGCVLGDLAELGYDTRVHGLRAADVGAPHGRFRVFIVATDRGRATTNPWSGGWREADTGRRHMVRQSGVQGGRDEGAGTSGQGGDTAVDAAVSGLQGSAGGRVQPGMSGAGRGGHAAPHADQPGPQGPQPARVVGGPDAALGGDPTAPHAGGQRHGGGKDPGSVGRLDGEDAGGARERERSRAVAGDRGAEAATDAAGSGRGTRVADDVPLRGQTRLAWGAYGPAIRRWESILGRPAPAPTELGPKGSHRLAPRFVEWMQGIPEGWVTDVPGLNRNAQLKALGNGVVSQQAEAALRYMLAAQEAAA